MVSYFEVAASGSDLEVAALQTRGVPARAVDRVADLFGVTKGRLMDVAGISASTYSRHVRTRKNLPRDASEALTRLVRLHALAAGFLAKPEKWFLEKTPLLDGKSPLEAAGTEAGGRAVEALLHRIEHGGPA